MTPVTCEGNPPSARKRLPSFRPQAYAAAQPQSPQRQVRRSFSAGWTSWSATAWNIGIPFGDLDALTPQIWDRFCETNVRGPFLLAPAAVRRAQRRGRIVNIASTAGLLPCGSSIGYATSKAALIHLTRSRCLAVALAPHVLVNSVGPGLVEATRTSRRTAPGRLLAADGHGEVQPASATVIPPAGSACSAAPPEMVRLPPTARVISTRRAWALGEAGMVTCRTPSA